MDRHVGVRERATGADLAAFLRDMAEPCDDEKEFFPLQYIQEQCALGLSLSYLPNERQVAAAIAAAFYYDVRVERCQYPLLLNHHTGKTETHDGWRCLRWKDDFVQDNRRPPRRVSW